MKFENLFIVSGDEKSKLYKVEDGQIQHLLDQPFPEISKYSISETGWISAIKIKRRRGKKSFIYCVKLDQEHKIIERVNIQIPDKYHVTALAMKNNTVYIGGHNLDRDSKESADLIDLSGKEKQLQSIIIPEEYEMAGKAIDDIMILEDRMILVDDLIYPKFLFEYDISKETDPKLDRIIELSDNGTYEHIKSGKISKNRIALYSSTIGMAGSGRHLNILNSKTFTDYGTLSSGISLFPKKQQHWFLDYTLWNNTLYLACGKKGLGILKLERNFKMEDVLFKRKKSLVNIDRFHYISNTCLVYQTEDSELKIIMMKEL